LAAHQNPDLSGLLKQASRTLPPSFKSPKNYKLHILHSSEEQNPKTQVKTGPRIINPIFYTKSTALTSSKIPRDYPYFLIRLCKNVYLFTCALMLLRIFTWTTNHGSRANAPHHQRKRRTTYKMKSAIFF